MHSSGTNYEENEYLRRFEEKMSKKEKKARKRNDEKPQGRVSAEQTPHRSKHVIC